MLNTVLCNMRILPEGKRTWSNYAEMGG